MSKETSHEAFFTAEELRKLRQKRPVIAQTYEVTPFQPTKFQKALKDLSDINEMLDQIWVLAVFKKQGIFFKRFH